MKTELVVALDFDSAEEAERLMRTLRGFPVIYKIGLELFSAAGPDWVRKCTQSRERIFLDLKLHDIPNTVAKTLLQIERMGVEFTTLHLTGGRKMLEKIPKNLTTKILGVSVLTSFTEEEWKSVLGTMSGMGQGDSILGTVNRFADFANEFSSIQGLVCSSHEIMSIRKRYPDLFLMVPGIRMQVLDQDDQGRVMSPAEASRAGASAIVMGRPITQSNNPRAAVEEILKNLN